MAPLIPGPRLVVRCPVCGRSHVRELARGQEPGVFVQGGCGHCRAPNAYVVGAPRAGALALHVAPWLDSPPGRWDAVAVDLPGQGRAVLRVVGLPGETLEVRGGDLVVDGALPPRPRRARRGWRQVYHSRPGRLGWIAPWGPVGTGAPGAWDLRLMSRPTWHGIGSGASPWLRYLERIDDAEPQDGGGPGEVAGDLAVGLCVARCDGEVQVGLERDGRVVAACLPLEGPEGAVRLEVDGQVVATRFGALPETPVDVAVEYCDRRVEVRLGEEVVLEWRDPLPPAAFGRAAPQVRALASTLIVEGFTIHREVSWRGGGRSDPTLGPVRVPAGHYFLLGDDPPRATDSRHVGPVPLEALRGRVLWPR